MGLKHGDVEAGAHGHKPGTPQFSGKRRRGSGAGCGRGEGPAAARPLLGDAGMFTLLTAAAAGGGAEPGGWAAARLAVVSAGRAGWEPVPAAARAEAIGPGSRSPQPCSPRGPSCPAVPVSLHGPAGWGRCWERAGRVEPPARVPRRSGWAVCSWWRAVQAAGGGRSAPRLRDPGGSSAAVVAAATGLRAGTGGTPAKTRLRADLIGHRGYLPLADWLNRFGCSLV